LHPLFGFPLADNSSAFEIGQPALHFFTYVEMILDIFECGVIGKILNERKSLPLLLFASFTPGTLFVPLYRHPSLVSNDSSHLQTGDIADAEIISHAILKNRLEDTATID
jgi:hypothetical protein